MPRGRPATHQSAEEKKAARSAENQRAYVKKKLKLQANALGEPVTGTFITHDAASLLNENAAAGILLPVPQDVGILTNNLDLLDIAVAQSQNASPNISMRQTISSPSPLSLTYEQADFTLSNYFNYSIGHEDLHKSSPAHSSPPATSPTYSCDISCEDNSLQKSSPTSQSPTVMSLPGDISSEDDNSSNESPPTHQSPLVTITRSGNIP